MKPTIQERLNAWRARANLPPVNGSHRAADIDAWRLHTGMPKLEDKRPRKRVKREAVEARALK